MIRRLVAQALTHLFRSDEGGERPPRQKTTLKRQLGLGKFLKNG